MIKDLIKNIPELPGCYIYKDKDKNIIYVGKAKNLKKRVLQYFSPRSDITLRTEQMITQIHDIEIHTVNTETEALILESNLIKKYNPKYNVLMKDDKSYTWIKISIKEEFPRILRIRDKDKQNDGNLYFGPYPSGKAVNTILRLLRKQFPFRTCNYDIKENQPQKKSRLCLFYHVGLCDGPCDKLISRIEYNKNIKSIVNFLRGNTKELIDEYKKDMSEYSISQEFEKAAELRDKINDIIYITQKILITSQTDEKVLEEEKKRRIDSALKELFEKTGSTNKNNFRIECYDISNIQGTNPVGSMIVFENGFPLKSDYRKFKIRSLNTPNDFAMLREMFTRRLSYLNGKETKDKSFVKFPDLIIVDGGKGQLSTVYKLIKSLKLNINIVGLAKREELIFFPENNKPLKLKRGSDSLYLVQRVRDEAHRFAITFHRQLRSSAALESYLDTIKGIGPKTKEKLIKEFKTIDNILESPLEELTKITTIAIAKRLKDYK